MPLRREPIILNVGFSRQAFLCCTYEVNTSDVVESSGSGKRVYPRSRSAKLKETAHLIIVYIKVTIIYGPWGQLWKRRLKIYTLHLQTQFCNIKLCPVSIPAPLNCPDAELERCAKGRAALAGYWATLKGSPSNHPHHSTAQRSI